MAKNEPMFGVGQEVWDEVAGEVGMISTVDYEESIEDYIYGVRFADGSEWASTDVVLLEARPPASGPGAE